MSRGALLLAGLLLVLLAGTARAQRAFFLVRHAEKVDASRDAALSAAGRARAERLSRMLRDAGIAAVYTSEFQRTRDTAAPLCRDLKLQPQVVKAGDTEALLAQARKDHADQAVLIVGHSNTLPAIQQALGVEKPLILQDNEYDNVLLVIPRRFVPPQVLRLHMPDRAP